MTSKQARWEYIVCVMGESKRKVTDQYSTVPHQHAGPVLAVVQDVALVDVAVAVDHPASFEVAMLEQPFESISSSIGLYPHTMPLVSLENTCNSWWIKLWRCGDSMYTVYASLRWRVTSPLYSPVG